MVWCRFGSWSLVIKSFFVQTSSTRFGQNFEVLRQDFEAEVAADPWLRLWRLFLVEILRLRLVKILKFKISQNADIWLMFWSCCLVEIMKIKSNQDLFENLWYDLKKLLWWAELNPWVYCAFGNVFNEICLIKVEGVSSAIILSSIREGVKKNVFWGALSQTMGRWGSKVPNFLVKITIQLFLLIFRTLS